MKQIQYLQTEGINAMVIYQTIEEYADKCAQARAVEKRLPKGFLLSGGQRWRVHNMPPEDKRHLHRAAIRCFGPKYEIVDFDIIRSEGREYRYNFHTGRFYGLLLEHANA